MLTHPEIPLHNNPAKLGARLPVRKQDVSFGPRTANGKHAWDTPHFAEHHQETGGEFLPVCAGPRDRSQPSAVSGRVNPAKSAGAQSWCILELLITLPQEIPGRSRGSVAGEKWLILQSRHPSSAKRGRESRNSIFTPQQRGRGRLCPQLIRQREEDNEYPHEART